MTTKYLTRTTLSLLALTLFSGSILMSSSTSAEDESVVDEVNISVPVSCSLSGTGMTSHTATIENGRYVSDIGTTTLKAFCNDNNGFAIYANGYTGDTLGNNKLIGSSTSSEIVTGTATTAGSPDVSNWAMKLETNSSATYALTLDNGFGNYSNVPSSYTKVAHRDSNTDLGKSAEGATLTSTYAAYIAKTQPADSYQGQVIYTLVHPASEEPKQPVDCEAGNICYQPNSSSVVGSMGKQSVSNNSEVTLRAPNYKREGYGFAGWSPDYSATANSKSPKYGPNETFTASSNIETEGLSLYAVWIKSAGTIQNWDGCSSLAQGATTALTDERDGNTYAVAKLADGKCWTIENLRLDDSVELSSTNTHNPSLPLNNTWYYLNQQGTLTTSNHLSATSDPTSTDPDTAWCKTNSSDCDDQSMLATNNTILFTNNTASSYSTSGNVYSYGNYYNWYSATAGNGKYSDSYRQGYESPGDICPAGWHLPKGGDKSQESANEFWQLIVTGLNGGTNPANYDSSSRPPYTETEATPISNALRSYPNNFVYSGYVYGSSVYDRSSSGSYWSAEEDYPDSAYGSTLQSDYVYPGTNSGYKYIGRTVRCVAEV